MRALAAVLVLLVCVPAQARPIELDDIHRIEDVYGPALSRDGERLAYTLGTRNLDSDATVSDIWLVDAYLATTGTMRLRFDEKTAQGFVTHAAPFTWADADFITVHFSYEAA